ncbi:hypothetical protein ACHAWF_011154 [Thalassiosira exigua]
MPPERSRGMSRRRAGKRPLETSHYPPRKRYREDVHYTGIGAIEGEGQREHRSQVDSENSSGTKFNAFPKTRKRRRWGPLIRHRNVKRSLAEPTSTFGRLIAQGSSTHILRECQSQFDSRASYTTKLHGLYGIGDEALLPARTFGGSSQEALKSLVERHDCIDSDKNENDADREDLPTGKETGMTSRQGQSMAGAHEEDVNPVIANNDQGRSPGSNAATFSSSPGAGTPDTTPLRAFNLPFDFMPGSSTNSNTQLRVRTITSIARHSPHRSKGRMSIHYHRSYSSPSRPSISSDDGLIRRYSPIIPCASKGPLMAHFETPIRMRPVQDYSKMNSTTFTQDPVSCPFNFMEKDIKTKPTNCSQTPEHRSTPRRMVSVAAKWLLQFLRPPTLEDDISTSSNPSTCSTAPPSDRSSNSHMESSQPRLLGSGHALTQRLNRFKNRTSISTGGNHPVLIGPNVNGVSLSKKSFSKCTSAPPHFREKLFEPKSAGQWKCLACSYTNPSEAMTCDSCMAVKEFTPHNFSVGEDSEDKYCSPTSLHDSSNSINEDRNGLGNDKDPGVALKDATLLVSDVEANTVVDLHNERVDEAAEIIHGARNKRSNDIDLGDPEVVAKISHEEHLQNQVLTKGKRTKIDPVKELSAHNIHPNASRSKKRNKDEDSDGNIDQIKCSKVVSENVDMSLVDDTSSELSFAVDDVWMDVDSPL